MPKYNHAVYNPPLRTRDGENLVIAVLGAMGMGKSSLLNAILQECMFATGKSPEPVTKTIAHLTKAWRLPPVGRNVHIIDTPGMCDANLRDRDNADNIAQFFTSLSHGVSAFLIVIHVRETKLDSYTQNMLRLFEELLGPPFWKYAVFVFTHVDEHLVPQLNVDIEELLDPEDGFAAVLRQLDGFNIPPQAELPLVFVSNINTRNNDYAAECFGYLYDTVAARERKNGGRKFTCTFFQNVLSYQGLERRNFIIRSVKKAANVVIPAIANSCAVM
ncbi:hypothetical protein BZG36_01258 [Bifiguratus adelaidae]|uniref:AIG1-type G domain-containing protein n=1 Tax=Bifiguratus adelaidae TaxID=1938954 RepID=A0A261Y5X2_9FUNG|nr:hypothetical protein BZG36_01258 [Bifiguratus adelaidae]